MSAIIANQWEVQFARLFQKLSRAGVVEGVGPVGWDIIAPTSVPGYDLATNYPDPPLDGTGDARAAHEGMRKMAYALLQSLKGSAPWDDEMKAALVATLGASLGGGGTTIINHAPDPLVWVNIPLESPDDLWGAWGAYMGGGYPLAVDYAIGIDFIELRGLLMADPMANGYIFPGDWPGDGSSGGGAIIGYLPIGCVSQHRLSFTITNGGSSTPNQARIDLDPSGVLSLSSASAGWVCLDGVKFPR